MDNFKNSLCEKGTDMSWGHQDHEGLLPDKFQDKYKFIIKEEYQKEFDAAYGSIGYRICELHKNIKFLKENTSAVFISVYRDSVSLLHSLFAPSGITIYYFHNMIMSTWVKDEYKDNFRDYKKTYYEQDENDVNKEKDKLCKYRNSIAHFDTESQAIHLETIEKLTHICLKWLNVNSIPAELYIPE